MILGKKLKTSVAIDEDLLKWVDSEIKTKRFASRSHAIEYSLQNMKKQK
jgi:Arc/MetJ-type ribon-helix-helix transcriptional regulator